jgi:hypothetical protein
LPKRTQFDANKDRVSRLVFCQNEPNFSGWRARAAFVLAETYDAHMLTLWGTYGLRGNRAKAELYALAYSRGIPTAKERIEALQ